MDLGDGAAGDGEFEPVGWDGLYESKLHKKKRGGKARSVFWMDIMSKIKQRGLRAVSRVRGQSANFEEVQPG